jgi:uncharacterized protein YjiS (DUF1127 family)
MEIVALLWGDSYTLPNGGQLTPKMAFLPTEENQMQFDQAHVVALPHSNESNRSGSAAMKHSRTVARCYSGSTLIDALLVYAIAWRKALLRRIAEWQRRAAGRREMMTLTDRDLHDIGIGRSEAEAEANKPFWET